MKYSFVVFIAENYVDTVILCVNQTKCCKIRVFILSRSIIDFHIIVPVS